MIFILGRLACNPPNEVSEGAGGHWGEHMHIASVSAWLGWNVGDSVSTNDVSTEEITRSEAQNQLRPARHVCASVGKLKRKVPNYPPVCLGSLVGMLTNSLRITLQIVSKF